MHPAPTVMADRTWKKSAKHNLDIISAPCLFKIAYWRRGTPCSITNGAPNTKIIRCANNRRKEGYLTKKILRDGPNSSVRLAYFQANRLWTELYKQETEILWRKDGLNRHRTSGPKLNSISSSLLDPPPFSLPTTLNNVTFNLEVK